MADIYKRVDCSVCDGKDIKWDRYECLICDEYNLCRKCFKEKAYSREHRPYHPMQVVLDKEQFFRFVNSIAPPKVKVRLYCPICGIFKTSVVDLQSHCREKHLFSGDRVKCPVCVLYCIFEEREERTSLWNLTDHLQDFHGDRGKYAYCNTCDKNEITGNRYSCLICDMYDQCETCYKNKQHDGDHMPYHPMQKVLPKEVYEAQNGSSVKIYRCPFCGEDKFSATGLADHCHELHSQSQSFRVCCPICTVCRVPFEEDSILNESFINHLTNYHGLIPNGLETTPRDCSICFAELDEKEPLELYCQCTHSSFHARCIKAWLASNPTCPICRAKRAVI